MRSFFAAGPLLCPPDQRASDTDRDTAVDILCAAVADGRLTLPDLEERVEAALCARTLRQLASLIADLISASDLLPPANPPARRVVPFFVPDDRWATLRSLLMPV